MDRLVVIGCGTVVPEPDRGASSYFVEAGDARVLMDCGPGAVQGMARLGLAWWELTDLALTHFHADHVGALPGLFFAFKHGRRFGARRAPLDVWGPVGTRDLFEGLASTLGDFLLDPGFPVRIHEVADGDIVRFKEGVELRVHDTPHTDESVALRLGRGGWAVGYSGDTGPSDTLGAFMSGVEVFVCECSLFDHEVGDNHLSPSRVARIARVARPGMLLLTHVYPHLREEADVAAMVAEAGYEGEIRVAEEGLTVSL